MRRGNRAGIPGSRGMVLILALWTLFLLSAFAVGLSKRSFQDISVARYFRSQICGRYAAEAIVSRAQAMLAQDTNRYDALNEYWSTGRRSDEDPSEWTDIRLGEGTVRLIGEGEPADLPRYGLVDEGRKVNLNTARADVLENLFRIAADLDPSQAHIIASAIIDWRDADSETREGGAEDTFYQMQKKPYDCKDGAFQVLDELLLVRGVTSDAFTKTRPFLTVYGDGKVNLNTASSTVLRSLGLSHPLVTKVLEFRRGIDGVSGTEDDKVFEEVANISQDLMRASGFQQGELGGLEQLMTEDLLSVSSQVYTAQIEISVAGRGQKVQSALSRNEGLLYWREL